MTAKSHALVAQLNIYWHSISNCHTWNKSQLEKVGIKNNAVQLTLAHGLKFADAFPATYGSSFCRISCILACIC